MTYIQRIYSLFPGIDHKPQTCFYVVQFLWS